MWQLQLLGAKHFGLPMLFGRSNHASFLDILDKVQEKIEGWRSRTLSQADKTILVKVVVTTHFFFFLYKSFA
jgi:hypothetical protein